MIKKFYKKSAIMRGVIATVVSCMMLQVSVPGFTHTVMAEELVTETVEVSEKEQVTESATEMEPEQAVEIATETELEQSVEIATEMELEPATEAETEPEQAMETVMEQANKSGEEEATQEITFVDDVLYGRIKIVFDEEGVEYTDAGNNTIVMKESVIATVTSLDLDSFVRDGMIVNLSGLEKFTALKYLNLDRNAISDLSPISGMTWLTKLSLYDNYLADISPICTLVNLESLNIGDNLIKKLPDMYWPNMKTFLVSSNHLTDVEKINKDSFPVVENLLLCGNEISDLSCVGEMTTVKLLSIAMNQITNEGFKPISGMVSLEQLDNGMQTYLDYASNSFSKYQHSAATNKITDFSPLYALPNLKNVDIMGYGFESVSQFVLLAERGIKIYAQRNAVTDFENIHNNITITDQEYSNSIQFYTVEMKIEIPEIISRVMNANDALYSDESVRFNNCSISDDGKYIVFDNTSLLNTTIEDELTFKANVSVGSGVLDRSYFRWTVTGVPYNGLVLLGEDNKHHWLVQGVTDTTINNLFPYDNKWLYMEEGIWVQDKYDFVDYDGGRFLVANGELHDVTGLALFNEEWYFLSKGQLINDYTGLASFNDEWFRVENGRFTSDYNGIQTYDGADFLVSAGKIRHDYSGLYLKEDGNWCYVANGQIQKQHTGFVQHDGEWFYLVDGVVATGADGIFEYDGEQFILGGDGRLVKEYTGLYLHTDGNWYYVAEGRIQKQYTGFAEYNGEWFYLVDGVVATGVDGIFKYDGADFLLGSDGRMIKEHSGLYQSADGKWYYVANGQVQTQYTGITNYDGVWFCVIGGVFAEDFSGWVVHDGAAFQVVNGMVVM